MSENYTPLYRKYRPQNLQEVVGQEHIKKALTNAINLKKISQAYLFTGPRGTGKTSIARILAKSLNCKEGPTINPCEVCPSCKDLKTSAPFDVIEIDAASNRSVESTQANILGKIQQAAGFGKYKVYIIDEVHMLSAHAFNALLKTLEEPPENVIFILATTEPQKVLETITSRCQRFDFRRITTEDIVAQLKKIAKLEKIKIDDDALLTIAKNAAGGMRDSLALLDQISVLDSAKTITSEDINKLLGRLSFDTLNKLSNSIINSDPQGAIKLLNEIYNSGNEPSQILINLMGYLKNLLIVKTCLNDELLLDLTQLNASQITNLKTQSENIETSQIIFLIEKTVYYIKELKTTTNQHLWLEIAVIDLANLAQNTSLLELQERISKLEGETITPSASNHVSKTQPPRPISVTPPIIPSPKADPVVAEKVQKKEEAKKITETEAKKLQPQEIEETPMPISKQIAKSDSDINNLWLNLLQNISSTPTVSLLNQHSRPIEISEEKIIIGCKENFLKILSSDMKRKSIEEGAKKIFNKDVKVIIKIADASDFTDAEKKNSINETAKKQQTTSESKKEIQVDSDELFEEDDYIKHKLAKTKKKEDYTPSDQVSMVIKLFDGKYIE